MARLTATVIAAAAGLATPAAAHDAAQHHVPLQQRAAGAFDGLGGSLTSFAAVPPGFTETTAFTGLTTPTNIEIAADGRVFVAEKTGLIKVFDGLGDPTASVYADLRTQTHDFWDRGLLGLALDPAFTTGRPYVYALYAYNKEPGVGTYPRWPDSCPSPPGATGDGCVVSGRLVRLDGGVEQVLIEDWCQQYPSHSVGDLAFGPDGALYISGGDGASFNFTDYGQDGSPVNPCGDPPGGRGGSMTPPTAEGGSLRSQDIRTTGDPTGLGGAILRVDPDTGAALPDNPNAGSSDANARRIITYGLRNPFRMTVRPGTDELWVGDVGWSSWEEINRIQSPTSPMRNLGWPCYEGNARQAGYDGANLSLCESLYAQGASAHTTPYFNYSHGQPVVAGETCPANSGSSTSGLAFHPGTGLPAAYQGALFFADYSRDCIWVALRGANGLPDMATRSTFIAGAVNPVDLEIAPNGDIFYADLDGGTIRRVRSTANQVPTAVLAATTPTSGAAPLTVSFDGTGSSDPDGDPLAFAWDLDGDGQYDDSTAQRPAFTYATPGTFTVRLRVSDPGSLSSTDQLTVSAGTPPTPTIATPAAGTSWRVGETLSFSGSAVSGTGAALPASALQWRLDLEHCETGGECHTHQIQSFNGIASGSFAAPDHEFPSHLVLRLTATDASGLATTVARRLDPRTVTLTFESQPAGLSLAVGGRQTTAPFTREVIAGSTNSLTAPSPQTLSGRTQTFSAWSDGGARTHDITGPAAAATYRATFTEQAARPGLVGAWSFDAVDAGTITDASGLANHGTVSGATASTAGRNGGALSFDGVNDWVTVADSPSLDLTTGMTLEGWVHPTAAGGWRTVALKETPGFLAYGMYSNEDGNRPSGHINVGGDIDTRGGVGSVPVNTWSHLATTYDGTTLRFYVNGTLASSRAVSGPIATSTGPLRFGGNAVWTEWFAGRMDDVRVYDRALTAGEITEDMTLPVGGDPGPRLAVSATTLAFQGLQGAASPAAKTVRITNAGTGALIWQASEASPWMSVSPASGGAPADLAVSVDTSGLAAGTYTGSIQVSAAAAASPQTVAVTLTVDPPPSPPSLATSPASLAFSATAGGAAPPGQSVSVTNAGGGTLSFTASHDRPWLSVAPASGAAPATLSVAVDPAGLAVGTHAGAVTVAAAGAAGSPRTIPVSLTVSQAPPVPSSLVGAWSFDETTGATAVDASGHGNVGTLTGATRSAAGRYGRALSFDGIDDWVTVADAPSLDLTTGMTLEAWVRPAVHGGDWRTVLLKEQPGQLAWGMYSNEGGGRPSGHAYVGGDRGLAGTSTLPLNTWSHLAVTYDGAALRLFVNGAQVAVAPLSGPMVVSASPLRIGGNAVWSEWFSGLIDEVRVHDRALTAAQIAADRDTPIATAGLLARRGAAATRRSNPGGRRSVRLIGRAYGTPRSAASKRRVKGKRSAPVHRPRWLKPRAF